MKLGAEPKKVGTFVALVAVAGIVYWINSSSDPGPPSSASRPTADAAGSAIMTPPPADGIIKVAKKREASGRASLSEWVPHPPDTVDAAKVDPTLRLDLLAKVQAIDIEGGTRNVFQFCPDCAQREAAAALAAANAKIPPTPKIPVTAPQPLPPAASIPKPPAPPPGPPPTPPINLKYYGYSTKYSDGEKKAFFLDGDDVIVAAEGEIIKKQYKVVRITVTSVQMEDTASKSTQTIPIQQDAPV